MRPTHGNAEQEVLQRITSVALILGGAIALAAAIGFPAGVDSVSLPAQYANASSLGNSPFLAGLRAAGVLAMVLGFSNIHHFIRFGAGAAWARIGVQTLIVSSVVVIAAEGFMAGLYQGTADGEFVTGGTTSMMNLGR